MDLRNKKSDKNLRSGKIAQGVMGWLYRKGLEGIKLSWNDRKWSESDMTRPWRVSKAVYTACHGERGMSKIYVAV